MLELIQRAFTFEVRAANDGERKLDVIASTDTIDAFGEVLVQDWDLERYKKNPVVLYDHNRWDYPIGHAENVRVEDGKLLATLKFVDEKASPTAERVWQGIRQGSLRSVSVGFRTKNKPTVAEVNGKNVLVLSGNELVEISVVPIPANPDAVALAAKSLERLRALVDPPQGDKPMSVAILLKTLLPILMLADTSSENDAVAEVSRLKGVERDLLAKTNTKSASEAIGAVSAAIANSTKLTVENEQLRKDAEAREKADIIRQGRADKKLSPKQAEDLEKESLDFVRGFVKLAHPNPAFASEHKERSAPVTLEWNGKKWGDLTFEQRHDLFVENHDLYVAMRDAADSN